MEELTNAEKGWIVKDGVIICQTFTEEEILAHPLTTERLESVFGVSIKEMGL